MAKAIISKDGLNITLPFPIGSKVWYPDIYQENLQSWGVMSCGHEYSWKLIGSGEEVFSTREEAVEYISSMNLFANIIQNNDDELFFLMYSSLNGK